MFWVCGIVICEAKKLVLFLMDYQNQNVSWQWQGDEYLHQKDVNFDLSKCGWNGIAQNEPDIPYMLEERTPVKACGEVPCHINDCDNMTKTPQENEDFSPPPKRRRMLDFDDVNEDILSSSLKSKERIDAIDDFLSEISRWEACLQEDLSPSGFEDLSQSEAWLADCLDVTNMNINSDEGSAYIPLVFRLVKQRFAAKYWIQLPKWLNDQLEVLEMLSLEVGSLT